MTASGTCRVPKSFFDDAVSAGPFEVHVAIGFAFEYVLTNLLFVPFIRARRTTATWAPWPSASRRSPMSRAT